MISQQKSQVIHLKSDTEKNSLTGLFLFYTTRFFRNFIYAQMFFILVLNKKL